MAANAVELTVEQAWFIAEQVGSGSFPWVLAITPPYSEPAAAAAFAADRVAELTDLGVLSGGGVVDPLSPMDQADLPGPPLARAAHRVHGRGHAARGGGPSDETTVVALRSGSLVTFTAMDIRLPRDLVPVVTAGLTGRRPADFPEFTVPTRAAPAPTRN
jgi:hypothetical protein